LRELHDPNEARLLCHSGDIQGQGMGRSEMIQEGLFTLKQEELTTNDHYTPKWLFDVFGVTFDIDVASPPNGVPWIPAKKFFTQEEDGLAQPWKGLVWCNPPYSDILPWVTRLNQHRNGIALLPHTKGGWREDIWREADGLVESKAVNQMLFHYQGRNNKAVFPTLFLAAWGDIGLNAISKIGRVR
jgi:hypothetical protein